MWHFCYSQNNIWCISLLLLLLSVVIGPMLQGVVAFSSQGDRIALTQIEQMIDGKYVILGHYDTQADNLTWTGLEHWQDNKVIISTEFIMGALIHRKIVSYATLNFEFVMWIFGFRMCGTCVSSHRIASTNFHFWAFTSLTIIFHANSNLCRKFYQIYLKSMYTHSHIFQFCNIFPIMRLLKIQSFKLQCCVWIWPFNDVQIAYIWRCAGGIGEIELKWQCVLWLQIPQDRTIVRRVLRTVSLSLFVCMSTVSGCGIFVAIALIVFNIWNNHRRWVFSHHSYARKHTLC